MTRGNHNKSCYPDNGGEIMAPSRFHARTALLLAGFIVVIMVMTAFPAYAFKATALEAKQRTFESPEEAAKALVDAARNNDKKELGAILGPGSQSLISSGDKVADKAGRERFVKKYEEKNSIEQTGDKAILSVGSQGYPLPIPLIKKGDFWVYDTKAGKEEIINRRIGRNELNAIDVLREYVVAQREYACKDRNGDGVLEYAQKLVSGRNDHDGLFWKTKEGEEESPFGPFIARAAKEGYKGKTGGEKPSPYHGYFYRVLKAQGENAKGGKRSYVVNNNMILGFAMVAYPARYGSSGVMTLIVNQDGEVYERDFGRDTAKVAEAMTEYDPDKNWKKVEGKAKP
jgi:hypothetical protein